MEVPQKPFSSGLKHCLNSCILSAAAEGAEEGVPLPSSVQGPRNGVCSSSAHLQTSLCGLPCSNDAGEWHLPFSQHSSGWLGQCVKSEVRRSGGVGLRVILNGLY